ncbi:MAG: diguanylate cyclase [Deltaproteobacteria bacterium]|nr:diguanylate cyclase [Deltaproteobacteria bacterium]
MTQVRVLLADKPSKTTDKLAAALRKRKLHVDLVGDAHAALARYAQSTPHVAIVGQGLAGPAFALCKALRAHDPAAVLLAMAADAKSHRAAERAGADATLDKPIDPRLIEASVRPLALLRTMRLAQTQSGGPIFDPLTGFYAFEHFKQALFVEVKRARRYKVPIAVILSSITAHGENEAPELRQELMGGLALAVRSATRDTDLPVAYGQHNVMILLPHTSADGAEAVGRRILFKIAKSTLRHEGRRLKTRISLGLAASGDGEHPFSELVHAAALRLKEAEARGGNCLVAK